MKAASVSELKARLSYYLREVERGGEVQVLDRGRPVARLVRTEGGFKQDDVLDRLVRAGLVKRGQGDAGLVLKRKPIDLGGSATEALWQDRNDRL